jgi:sulfatase maturation enzyme AslB (radical SAM superfamily)
MLDDLIEAGDYGHPVLINWDIIDKCQFKCTYCYATDFNKDEFSQGKHHHTWKLVLHRLSKLDFDWIVDIRGGEPTLHPHFHDIITALEGYPHCKKISIASNMGARLEVYQALDIPNSKVELHPSYHVEYPNQFLRKVSELAPTIKHMVFFVEIIMYPKQQYYQQLLDMIHEMESRNILFGTVLVRPNKFWDGVYDQGFWETFGRWVKDDTNPYSQSIRHVKTTGTEYVNEAYLLENQLHYNGYQCQQMAYNVLMNGDFTNVCTGTRLPINAKEADYKQVVTCPNTVPCYCYPMLLYKKKNPRYINE